MLRRKKNEKILELVLPINDLCGRSVKKDNSFVR